MYLFVLSPEMSLSQTTECCYVLHGALICHMIFLYIGDVDDMSCEKWIVPKQNVCLFLSFLEPETRHLMNVMVFMSRWMFINMHDMPCFYHHIPKLTLLTPWCHSALDSLWASADLWMTHNLFNVCNCQREVSVTKLFHIRNKWLHPLVWFLMFEMKQGLKKRKRKKEWLRI